MMDAPAMVSYFKRDKMEVDLADLPAPEVPDGFRLIPWDPGLLQAHADVLFGCFQQEIDAVFPSLGGRAGCGYLMAEISRKAGAASRAGNVGIEFRPMAPPCPGEDAIRAV
jgi:hypothetical protein